MYPEYDSVYRPEMPKTPFGCGLYFLGFCVFGIIAFAIVSWLT